MPAKPVALLSLDTRANGPAYCKRCRGEVEEALLMSDALVVCPECRTPIQGWGFEEFSEAVVSVSSIPRR
jgi:hypothetical protein